MEEQKGSHDLTLRIFLQNLSQCNLLIVVDFLDDKTIFQILSNSCHQRNQYQSSKFLKVISVKSYLNKYLNRMDKSDYISFYSDSEFKTTQNLYIKNFWINSYSQFNKIQSVMIKAQQGLNSIFSNLTYNQTMFQKFISIMSNPNLPEIYLKKGNIGMYCNSGFQFHLVYKKFPISGNKYTSQFVKDLIYQFIDIKVGENSSFQQPRKLQANQASQKYLNFNEFWYKINFQNYQEYLINQSKCQQSKIHNCLVYLVLLFQAFFQGVDCYLQAYSQDPTHQFVQFNLRYLILRQSMLQLQDQFGILFDTYNKIGKAMVSQVQEFIWKSMSIWHCLLSKWYIVMQKRHQQMNLIYCSLLKRLNFSQLISSLQQNLVACPEYVIYLQNQLKSKNYYFLGNSVIKTETNLEEYLKDNYVISQLLKDFEQYLVDISINQQSVHWCGHSEHDMHIPFRNHQEIVIESLNDVFQRICKICYQIDNKSVLFGQVINKIFWDLDQQYLKPVTLKKLMKEVNSKWNLSIVIQEQKTQNLEIYNTGLQNQLIKNIDFSQRDNRLEHFNLINNIPTEFDYSNNIVIQSEDFNNSLKISNKSNSTVDSYSPTYEENKQTPKLLHKTSNIDIQI